LLRFAGTVTSHTGGAEVTKRTRLVVPAIPAVALKTPLASPAHSRISGFSSA
jgi:hypothetical protein